MDGKVETNFKVFKAIFQERSFMNKTKESKVCVITLTLWKTLILPNSRILKHCIVEISIVRHFIAMLSFSSLPCNYSFTEYLWKLVETLNRSVTLSAFGGPYFYFSSLWKKLLQEPNWFGVTKTRQLYWRHDKEHAKNINECFGSRQTLLWNRKHPTCASTSFVLVYGRVLLFNFWSSKV